MARPKLVTPVTVVRLTLSLREGEDDDLTAFFERVPARRRAKAVMTALRQGGMSVVEADIDEDDEAWEEAFEDMLF